MKYRGKEIVEAMELTFEGIDKIKGWVGGGTYHSTPPMRAVTGIQFAINMVALFGEWIVKDEDGTFRVYDPITFAKTYEPADESAPQQEAVEWVSVENRLPGFDTEVLICVTDEFGDTLICVGEYLKTFTWYKPFRRIDGVTHWQPFPKPPKS